MSSTCKKRRFVSHGGDIWGFSRKYNIPLEEVLEFSGPINFLGPSPKAVEAVKQNAKLIRSILTQTQWSSKKKSPSTLDTAWKKKTSFWATAQSNSST